MEALLEPAIDRLHDPDRRTIARAAPPLAFDARPVAHRLPRRPWSCWGRSTA